MSNAKGPTPQLEVSDATAAFRKLEDFTRRVLAVPKKEIDRKLAEEKAKKSRKRS